MSPTITGIDVAWAGLLGEDIRRAWLAGDTMGALAHAHRALKNDPNDPRVHGLIAILLATNNSRRDEGLHHALEAARLDPLNKDRIVLVIFYKQQLCRWENLETLTALAKIVAQTEPKAISPFHALHLDLSGEDLLQVASAQSTAHAEAIYRPLPHVGRPPSQGNKLRVGYLSSDFWDHPVGFLVVGVLEQHFRTERIDVVHYATITPVAGGTIAGRIEAAGRGIVDLSGLDDRQAAERIRADALDVLVDLNGHTNGARPRIAAWRPAPVQVAWLGYPGTTGAPWMDYVIVDHVVAPYGTDSQFSEKLVRIGCYQANDDRREVATNPGSRADHGLPEQAVVYTCFNQPIKITPSVFAGWMRILQAVPGSVLWLIDMAAGVRTSLSAAAAAQGIEPQRLIFAPFLPQAQHLARLTHADLMLDTRPYNGHTTASDALRMGVPVITWPTDCFQGRVAASLLTALGVTDSIVLSQASYEALAIELGHNTDQRQALSAKIAQLRLSSRLFDAAACAAEVEHAYQRMAIRAARGQPPLPFDV